MSRTNLEIQPSAFLSIGTLNPCFEYWKLRVPFFYQLNLKPPNIPRSWDALDKNEGRRNPIINTLSEPPRMARHFNGSDKPRYVPDWNSSRWVGKDQNHLEATFRGIKSLYRLSTYWQALASKLWLDPNLGLVTCVGTHQLSPIS